MELSENWLKQTLELLAHRCPAQHRKLLRLLPLRESAYRKEADHFFNAWFTRPGAWSLEESLEAYLRLLDEMKDLQADYIRTGRYPNRSFAAVEAGFYKHPDLMRRHLEALALAQFLWIDQWERFAFFSNWAQALDSQRHLEVGPGHGLYLEKTIRSLKVSKTRILALDVSPDSLQAAASVAGPRASYISVDFLQWDPQKTFDSLTLGEVLEHVESPARFLEKAAHCLRPGGSLFISTPLHAPMPDHISAYANVEALRRLLTAPGFRIRAEHLCAADKLPLELAFRFLKPVMYCAILKRPSSP
mgnify:CR=1 FL=1